MLRTGKRLWTVCLGLVVSLMVSAQVRYITTEQFKQKIFDYTQNSEWKYANDTPCVVDFYTTWCGPCKRLAPVMDSLSHVYEGRVIFYKADTEKERELAYAFQISSIPQVLYVPKNGQPALLKGLYPTEEIVRIINEHVLPNKPKENAH